MCALGAGVTFVQWHATADAAPQRHDANGDSGLFSDPDLLQPPRQHKILALGAEAGGLAPSVEPRTAMAARPMPFSLAAIFGTWSCTWATARQLDRAVAVAVAVLEASSSAQVKTPWPS